MKDETYTLRINGPLLRKQRKWLLKLADKDPNDNLEGIIALLDEIADQAHDNYGIDCLILEED